METGNQGWSPLAALSPSHAKIGAPRNMTESHPFRIVDSIGRALVVVPSLSEALDRWESLGFRFEGSRSFAGFDSNRAAIAGADLCLLDGNSKIGSAANAPLHSAVQSRLKNGAGLVGWTFGVSNLDQSLEALEGRGVTTRYLGDGLAAIDETHTPGALTLLEEREPAPATPGDQHPNGVVRTDHIVLLCGDSKATAEAYAKNFALKPRFELARKRHYAYAKIGPSILEIVGPPEPSPSPHSLWGLALFSEKLDECAALTKAAGLSSKDPHPSVQGGRILPLPKPVDGVAVAFLES